MLSPHPEKWGGGRVPPVPHRSTPVPTSLDLSAAFDTILMDRLSLWYSVSGVALSWFKCYLSGKH